jgi:hypothetical protein
MPTKKKSPPRRRPSAAPARARKAQPAAAASSRSTAKTAARRGTVTAAPSIGARLWLVAQRYGALRGLLAVTACLFILFSVRPGTPAVYDSWQIVPTVLLPVLAPLIFMLLLLDALMGRVMMVDQRGTERERLRTVVIVNLVLAFTLLAFWTPYYLALGK